MAQVDFSYLHAQLQRDADLRDRIRDTARTLEHAQRSCAAVLARAHSHPEAHTAAVVTAFGPTLLPLRAAVAQLAGLVPPAHYYRHHDAFARPLQHAAYAVVLAHFLQHHDVPSPAQVALALGIQDAWHDHFFLTTEDYLHSLISLVNELSRLAINRVTLGDYQAPVEYSRFAKELSNAFGLLNLKNDSLRKRFDSIKYDVKRLEEVVYDLSLRGLLPSTSTSGMSTTTVAPPLVPAPGPAPASCASLSTPGAAPAPPSASTSTDPDSAPGPDGHGPDPAPLLPHRPSKRTKLEADGGDTRGSPGP